MTLSNEISFHFIFKLRTVKISLKQYLCRGFLINSSFHYVNIMLLGHTRLINKYVNIKCSLFLEIRDLTSFCFYSKNYKCVYPLHNNKYNQPIKLWCAICRLYKARAMYKFSEGFVSKSWFAEKGRNLTSLSQGKDAGFFLLKHFI